MNYWGMQAMKYGTSFYRHMYDLLRLCIKTRGINKLKIDNPGDFKTDPVVVGVVHDGVGEVSHSKNVLQVQEPVLNALTIKSKINCSTRAQIRTFLVFTPPLVKLFNSNLAFRF